MVFARPTTNPVNTVGPDATRMAVFLISHGPVSQEDSFFLPTVGPVASVSAESDGTA